MDLTKFLVVAEVIASFSKDPSTKVGAVILDSDGNILATGWNGFPRGLVDSEDRLWDRPTKYKLTVHAEANAIAASARTGRNLSGATIVVSSLAPCHHCAGLIIQSGIKRVICPRPNNERWADSNETAKMMFDEAGVQVEYI